MDYKNILYILKCLLLTCYYVLIHTQIQTDDVFVLNNYSGKIHGELYNKTNK